MGAETSLLPLEAYLLELETSLLELETYLLEVESYLPQLESYLLGAEGYLPAIEKTSIPIRGQYKWQPISCLRMIPLLTTGF